MKTKQQRDDEKLYVEECAKMDAVIGDPVFVCTTGSIPELRAATPRQGGELFARFYAHDEESFLNAAKYVGLTKREITVAREQAESRGVM